MYIYIYLYMNKKTMIIWTTAKTVEKSRLTAHNPVCERVKKEREGERERTEKKRLGDQVR